LFLYFSLYSRNITFSSSSVDPIYSSSSSFVSLFFLLFGSLSSSVSLPISLSLTSVGRTSVGGTEDSDSSPSEHENLSLLTNLV